MRKKLELQPASLDIYDTKYRLKNEAGENIDTDINATFERVATALSNVEPTDKREAVHKDFRWALENGAIPAGRITSNAGVGAHKSNASLINCFAYETPVLTDRGIFPMGALADAQKRVNVLNGKGKWVSVMFDAHGQQEVHTLNFKYADNKKSIGVRATKGHRWVLHSGAIITTEFWLTSPNIKRFRRIDNIIAPVQPVDSTEYSLGVLHGATYGDGTRIKSCKQTYNVTLIGGKLDIVPYLPSSIGEGISYNSIPGVNKRFTFTSEIPLKELPKADICSYSYLKGFFSGILATDGNVHSAVKSRSVSLCVIGGEDLMEFLKKYLPIIGVNVTGCRKDFGKGEWSNFGKRNKDIFRLNIHPSTVSPEDVLRKFHASHFYQTTNGDNRSKTWTFVDISTTTELVEVYCCTEPETQSFCISHGLLTKNCVVSGTIEDSIDGIFKSLRESAQSLAVGNGIGYEFSTIRPNGAFVSGAGAATGGALDFMDCFDVMCARISSAGGRRGAQMGTFDIRHPEVVDFISAKREDGRLRKFNLSVLITDDFIQAVKDEAEWEFSFPITVNRYNADDDYIWRDFPVTDNYVTNVEGLVACERYGSMPAMELWNLIMQSTFDYAEPGFILIDRMNQLNPLTDTENFRATNPCVIGSTRLATQHGLVRMDTLNKSQVEIDVTVDQRAEGNPDDLGAVVRSAIPVFESDPDADVWRVVTEAGYELTGSEWHDFHTGRGKVALKDLKVGDDLHIQSGKGQFGTQGDRLLGILMGFITGDGHFTKDGKGNTKAVVGLWNENRQFGPMIAEYVTQLIADSRYGKSTKRVYKVSVVDVPKRDMCVITSVILTKIMDDYGFDRLSKHLVPEVIWRGTEETVMGYLSALFQADGTVQRCDKNRSCSIRLSSSYPPLLKDVQILLANFGILARIYKRREAGTRMLPDGHGGKKLYPCKADYELIIGGQSREIFMREIRFLGDLKNEKYQGFFDTMKIFNSQKFITPIVSIEHMGKQPVFDTTQKESSSLIMNGLSTFNCGEQSLPPYGACLLGSINLVEFVTDPFTDQANFDYGRFASVVKVFHRMLDNVVELNGLKLPEQIEEITNKRRHGMGFLGLGSALVLLGIDYGSKESLEFTESVTKLLALTGYRVGMELAKEKGRAPIFEDSKVLKDFVNSEYMTRIFKEDPVLRDEMLEHGCRYTHCTSIAPTGTIALSLGNNVSNGIEPSFSHQYSRNIIRADRATKEKVTVYSYESLLYNEIQGREVPIAELPPIFRDSSEITPKEHVDVQAAAQYWIDSSISKTLNVPTDYPFEDFKDIYLYGIEKGLKGLATFRFNPEAFQGVLVREEDLEATQYVFALEDGSEVVVRGSDTIEYDGAEHSAANLFDALKEGTYNKY